MQTRVHVGLGVSGFGAIWGQKKRGCGIFIIYLTKFDPRIVFDRGVLGMGLGFLLIGLGLWY